MEIKQLSEKAFCAYPLPDIANHKYINDIANHISMQQDEQYQLASFPDVNTCFFVPINSVFLVKGVVHNDGLLIDKKSDIAVIGNWDGCDVYDLGEMLSNCGTGIKTTSNDANFSIVALNSKQVARKTLPAHHQGDSRFKCDQYFIDNAGRMLISVCVRNAQHLFRLKHWGISFKYLVCDNIKDGCEWVKVARALCHSDWNKPHLIARKNNMELPNAKFFV